MLQHAHNPVDWYPWGEEALKQAKENGTNQFSYPVGYSACHWCHVMERESFEDNESIADLMNADISSTSKWIAKNGPIIDEIYMQATTAMNQGHGGWPMTVFLTPDSSNLIFAGTYFPTHRQMGETGLCHDPIVTNIARSLDKRPIQYCCNSAERFTSRLQTFMHCNPTSALGSG